MELTDSFGRIHKDLRISVTDRCNFRCNYCMPEEGLDWTKSSEYLTFDEIARLASIFAERFGFTSIRLTGGEPTLRPKLFHLISQLAELDINLALTTNGSDLVKNAMVYKEAGLDRLNISLDSLNPETFYKLTNRDELERVVDGIKSAKSSNFDSVKINVVIMRGVNDSEVVDFVDFGIEQDVIVRFIEFMPLEAHGIWDEASVYSAKEILSDVSAKYSFDQIDSGSSPSQRFVTNVGSEFGIIPSVTDKFCSSCDRVRLTCDGQIRNCLFASTHLDLRSLIRGGASDEDLIDAISQEVFRKAESHGIGQVNFIRPSKSMSQLGG